ncbi:MAG: cytochrome P450 [Gammaproteobacteria bacterium]
MGSYLEKIEQAPLAQKWSLVRKWMDEVPFALYEELRAFRPVLALPELTMVTRFSDCASVLRQHDVFSVAPYQSKQGDYWMAQDDTARHWREKSIMRSVLDLEQLSDIRHYVAEKASSLLQKAQGSMEVVNGLCRAVPIVLVQERFGFDESDPKDLFEWSYWNQYDAFHNQPFDLVKVGDPELIIVNRKAANKRMVVYLVELIQRRTAELQAGKVNNDPVTRLLKLSMSGALEFDIPRVVQNVGGLLIGAVETTSHAVINALAWLLEHPELFSRAVSAAAKDDPSEFDGYVFEALRFDPAFPYFFRICERATQLSSGTDYACDITPGTTVMMVTHSAMFDATAFPDPKKFDPTRPETNAFHFGQGLHECLGRHIARKMIPEIVRQVLLLPGIHAAGQIDKKGGSVPEHYLLKWNDTGNAA